ncbi:MAG: hypothetical protein WCW47_01585 [Candidatus Paceibacterota bacterium]|jgi:hypothetical protein
MKQKILYLVCFLLILILVGGCAYLVFSKKSDIKNSDIVTTATTTATTIEYKNTQYGFGFTLQKSWEGYTIIVDDWEGYGQSDVSIEEQMVAEKGPLIFIQHPEWTEDDPRQSIPIMVFTLSQWDKLVKDEFHIGAAPINPSELGRNNKYVFAIPARYNFAYPTGYEEVEEIINDKSLFRVF